MITWRCVAGMESADGTFPELEVFVRGESESEVKEKVTALCMNLDSWAYFSVYDGADRHVMEVRVSPDRYGYDFHHYQRS